MNDGCNGIAIKGANSQGILDFVTGDSQIRVNEANYMCTTTCPCPMSTDFSSWNETYLNSINRTKMNAQGYVPLVTSNIGTTYSNYISCYNSISLT